MEWNKENISKAARDFSQWQGDAVIMCDSSDGAVWTDTFIGTGTWKRYKSETIKKVVSKRGVLERNMKISKNVLDIFLEAEVFKYKSYEDMPREMLELLMHYGF